MEFHDLSLLGLQKNIDKNSNSKNDFINKIISKYDPQGLTNHEYYDNIEYGILYVQINRKVNLEIHYNTMSNKINKIRFATSR